MKFALTGLMALMAGMALVTGPAAAQEIETRGGHCNDTYFGSDGGGVTGCLEYALSLNDSVIGIGIFGAEPEQFDRDKKGDRLKSLSRINAWYGRTLATPGFESFLSARAGIEGGVADDIGSKIQDIIHQLVGENNHKIVSTHGTTVIAGVSGWARKDFALSNGGDWTTTFAPYGHGAVGNDTVEAGGGLLLALQPSGEAQPLALLLPKTGAYAPTFGGDGIGIFAALRGVALETLYGDAAEPFIAEAGLMGQATFWDFVVVGASASCTTRPYEGAGKPDCKATLQMGGLF